jgi:hypothetical protein
MGSDVVKRWEEGALELELRVSATELRLVWTGKSADRETSSIAPAWPGSRSSSTSARSST